MEKEFRLKRNFLISLGVWTVFFIITPVMTHYFIRYRPLVQPYLEWWYPLVIAPFLFSVVTYLYHRNKIKFKKDHIVFPGPYTRTKKPELKYEEIEKVVIKEKEGQEYLYCIMDEKYNEYKISNLTGRESAKEILKVISNILKKKNINVNIIRD